MSKKRVVVIIGVCSAIGVGIGLSLRKNSGPSNTAEIIDQSVRIKTSALKKSSPRTNTLLKDSKTLKIERQQDQQELAEVSKKIIEMQNFGELGETFKTSLAPALTNKNINADKIIAYIDNFDFNTQLETELKKIHREDLYSLLEVLEHPLSKKLRSLEKDSQMQYAQALQSGQTVQITEEKKFLIDQILEETNSLEQTEKVIESILFGTYSAAMLQTNQKKTLAEVNAESKQLANQIAAQQMPALTQIFEITYNNLNPAELEDYLGFVQKSNARRATEVSLQATEKVLTRFLKGLTKELVSSKAGK